MVIHLKRGHHYQDFFRGYSIWINNRCFGYIQSNSERLIEVSDHQVEVVVKVDWCSSPVYRSTKFTKDYVSLEVFPNPQRYWLWDTIRFLTVHRHKYLVLQAY